MVVIPLHPFIQSFQWFHSSSRTCERMYGLNPPLSHSFLRLSLTRNPIPTHYLTKQTHSVIMGSYFVPDTSVFSSGPYPSGSESFIVCGPGMKDISQMRASHSPSYSSIVYPPADFQGMFPEASRRSPEPAVRHIVIGRCRKLISRPILPHSIIRVTLSLYPDPRGRPRWRLSSKKANMRPQIYTRVGLTLTTVARWTP